MIRVKGGAPVSLDGARDPARPGALRPAAGRRALFEPGHVVALAWTALAEDDRTAQALLELNRRARLGGLRRRGARTSRRRCRTSSTPTPRGHIGLIAPGRVPVRRQGDGRWPVPGWSGDYDWQGWIPFAALPRALDPPDGLLFNANNRLVPQDYPYLPDRRLGAALPRAAARRAAGRRPATIWRASRRSRPISCRCWRGICCRSCSRPRRRARRRRRRRRRSRRWDRVMRADAPRAAAVRGLVPRAVAADLRRRAGRAVPELLAAAAGVHGRGS